MLSQLGLDPFLGPSLFGLLPRLLGLLPAGLGLGTPSFGEIRLFRGGLAVLDGNSTGPNRGTPLLEHSADPKGGHEGHQRQ